MSLSERDIKVAIVSGIICLIVAVVMLDINGYIKHVGGDEQSVIDEFKLVVLTPGAEMKLSSKSANKEAFCANGYLMVRPQDNKSGKTVAGVLVDGKNRPIPCSTSLPSPNSR